MLHPLFPHKMSTGPSTTLAGSGCLTVALAGAAVVVSAVTYISNKRRSALSTIAANRGGFQSVSVQPQTKGNVAGQDASSANSRGVPHSTFPQSNTGPTNRSYYYAFAERHVKRHNATTMEWRDDVLGVRMLFSPILFAVETEERQAPLLLVGLRYLRQPEHRVAITFEYCETEETAENYRELSLERVCDCAKLLSGTGNIRIGSAQLPSAEYCYLDRGNKLRFALSVFLTSKRLAVTAQYIADTRVKSVLPTAFNELVRSIQFSEPRSSPSYLLCAEPRLGLGFRLPLDFVMDEHLRELLTIAEETTVTSATPRASGGEGPNGSASHSALRRIDKEGRNSSNGPRAAGNAAPSTPDVLWGFSVPHQLPDLCAVEHATGGGRYGFLGNGETNGNSDSVSVQFATISSLGPRRIVVVACYEPLPAGNFSWQTFFEHHLRAVVRRFSVHHSTDGSNAYSVSVVRSNDELQCAKSGKQRNFVVQLQQIMVPTNGDSAGEDDPNPTLQLEGALCVQEVLIDPNNVCAAHLRHPQGRRSDGDAVSPTDLMHMHTDKDGPSGEAFISAYLSVFCLRIRSECVSMCFLFPTACHTLEEVVTFCRRTIDTMSLGNHYGQSTSLIYCNKRHEVLPFSILLNPACAAATATVVVREPIMGEPLAAFCVGGMDGLTVHLRVFPIPFVAHTSQVARRRATSRLEKLVRDYLLRLPGRVCVHHWETTMLGASAALEVHYEQLCDSDDDDGDSDSFVMDNDMGRFNPFSLLGSIYCHEGHDMEGAECPQEQHTPVIGMSASAVGSSVLSRSAEHMLLRAPSLDSREESTTLQVAVVVCCEGCAFLFLASLEGYPLAAVRQVVRQFASNLSVSTGVTA